MFHISETISKKLIIFLIFAITLVAADKVYAKPYGIVLIENLRVRKAAAIDSKQVHTLKKGNRFQIKGYDGSWIKISFKKVKGFVAYNERFIKVFDKTEKGRLKRARVRARSIDNKIQTNLKLIEAYKIKEKGLINVLSEIDQSLYKTGKQLKEQKLKLKAISRQAKVIEKEEIKLSKEIEKIESYISKRVIAFYKLKRAGTMNFLASADSVYDVMVREKALFRFVKSDLTLFNKRNQDMLRLLNLQNNLATKKQMIGSLKDALERKESSFRSERSERKRFLSHIRSRKVSRIAAIKELEKAGKALDAKISSISIDIEHKKRKPVSSNFGFLKGRLEMPVKGKIVSFYGASRSKKYNIVTFKSGIKIRAKRGEPVQAVFGGEILFASWFKGYGNMMIINHGNHYYTLYAHMEDLFKTKGDKISKGDVIATVGDTGSISGAGLHFEIRHHGKPIDPLKWLKKG